jgi:hypothetical protein
MRIAVSGTHCCGKSTLISEFLLAHPDFVFEPEPYTVLQDDYGESFAAEPSADDFYRQLEFNVDRLRQRRTEAMVIYERSPVDFLAYLLALKDLRRDEAASPLADKALGIVMEAIAFLDLILFLPIKDLDGMVVPDSEDPELRGAVDELLAAILIEDELDVFKFHRPVVLEAAGSTAARLKLLDSAIA